VNRIAPGRPDVLERMKAGEFETVREAARATGTLPASGGGGGNGNGNVKKCV
jgi:hypothetical protein